MKRLPTRAEAKAHAKYLSKTLNICLSYAQDAVALRYNCNDWLELSTVFGQLTDRYISFYGLTSAADKLAFSNLLSSCISELRTHLHTDLHVQESLMRKTTEGQWTRISEDIMSAVTYELSENAPCSVEDMVRILEFHDDSISRVLTHFNRQGALKMAVNPWLEPWVFGLRFYAYYHFQDKFVTITSREWDLDIHDAYIIPPHDRVFTRPWFQHYMAGYLSHLTKQFMALGYDGVIKICRVNNYRALDFQKGIPEPHQRTGIYCLYTALLACGGEGKWSVSKDGHKYDFGIEVPFESLA